MFASQVNVLWFKNVFNGKTKSFFFFCSVDKCVEYDAISNGLSIFKNSKTWPLQLQFKYKMTKKTS